jgi:hypothetical protein
MPAAFDIELAALSAILAQISKEIDSAEKFSGVAHGDKNAIRRIVRPHCKRLAIVRSSPVARRRLAFRGDSHIHQPSTHPVTKTRQGTLCECCIYNVAERTPDVLRTEDCLVSLWRQRSTQLQCRRSRPLCRRSSNQAKAVWHRF